MDANRVPLTTRASTGAAAHYPTIAFASASTDSASDIDTPDATVFTLVQSLNPPGFRALSHGELGVPRPAGSGQHRRALSDSGPPAHRATFSSADLDPNAVEDEDAPAHLLPQITVQRESPPPHQPTNLVIPSFMGQWDQNLLSPSWSQPGSELSSIRSRSPSSASSGSPLQGFYSPLSPSPEHSPLLMPVAFHSRSPSFSSLSPSALEHYMLEQEPHLRGRPMTRKTAPADSSMHLRSPSSGSSVTGDFAALDIQDGIPLSPAMHVEPGPLYTRFQQPTSYGPSFAQWQTDHNIPSAEIGQPSQFVEDARQPSAPLLPDESLVSLDSTGADPDGIPLKELVAGWLQYTEQGTEIAATSPEPMVASVPGPSSSLSLSTAAPDRGLAPHGFDVAMSSGGSYQQNFDVTIPSISPSATVLHPSEPLQQTPRPHQQSFPSDTRTYVGPSSLSTAPPNHAADQRVGFQGGTLGGMYSPGFNVPMTGSTNVSRLEVKTSRHRNGPKFVERTVRPQRDPSPYPRPLPSPAANPKDAASNEWTWWNDPPMNSLASTSRPPALIVPSGAGVHDETPGAQQEGFVPYSTSPPQKYSNKWQGGMNGIRHVGSLAGRHAAKSRRKDPSKQGEFVCEHCGADFTAKHNLRNHLNSHQSVKDYACGKCRQAFGTSHVMKRHEGKCSGGRNET